MNTKYTLQHFLWPLDSILVDLMQLVMARQAKLTVEWLPVDVLGHVLKLAAYVGPCKENALVDNYPLLVARTRQHLHQLKLYDKFFVSSIIIMHYRDQVPELASYRMLNIPEIYRQLRGDY